MAQAQTLLCSKRLCEDANPNFNDRLDNQRASQSAILKRDLSGVVGAATEADSNFSNSTVDAKGFRINDDHSSKLDSSRSSIGRPDTKDITRRIGDIIDLRGDQAPVPLAEMIRDGLCCGDSNQRSMPSLALWDGQGLELFEKITKLPDYYLSWVETEILEQKAHAIAKRIEPGCMIVDLGCGDTQKIRPILQALDDMAREVDYYAMDVSQSELERCVGALSRLPFTHVRCYGLLGTFEDTRHWLQTPEISSRPKCLLSLGSTIGNMPTTEATAFLSGFVDVLRCQRAVVGECKAQPESLMVIGLDSCTSEQRVRKAYKDPAKLNAQFLLNSLKHANSVLGYDVFRQKEWKVEGEWIHNSYSQSLVPQTDIVFEGVRIKAGEEVHVVQSQKYGCEARRHLWDKVGLKEVEGWPSQDPSFGMLPASFINLWNLFVLWEKRCSLRTLSGFDPMISLLAIDNESPKKTGGIATVREKQE